MRRAFTKDNPTPSCPTLRGWRDTDIQIVNYQTKPYLNSCLESLLADLQHGPKCKISVVDNGSGDDLSDLARKYADKVTFLQLSENIGFGRAHNWLASVSDDLARTILLVNPDILLQEPNTVSRLLDRILSDPTLAVAGPQLLTEKGDRQLWDHGNFPYFFPTGPSFSNQKPTRVPWVSGAFFLVDAESFRQEEGFDPNLFLYFEEVELCKRLQQKGKGILYDPTICVQHVGSVSTHEKKRELFLESFRYVVNKHHSRPVAAVMDFVYERLPESFFR